MRESEREAKQACAEVIDRLIDFQKKNISGLEIMKEHINDMTTEQFDSFSGVFAIVIAPEILDKTAKTYSSIAATNDTIEHIKEEEE